MKEGHNLSHSSGSGGRRRRTTRCILVDVDATVRQSSINKAASLALVRPMLLLLLLRRMLFRSCIATFACSPIIIIVIIISLVHNHVKTRTANTALGKGSR